ncbi:MAG: two-component system, OmpR family, response regulator protein BraR/BceR [Abditibacteriota bacterium]|nr:two-component system, OmpR family, response regulator protein BraR/BceR [Abditibacteriota bacterium]
MAQLIKTPLLKAGLTLEHTADIRSGLEKFRSRQAHIVLLSLGLPRIGGVALCPEIRKSSTVPIAILSVRTRKEDHLHALNLGADDFIVVRPIDEHVMVMRVLTLLRRVYQYGPIQASATQAARGSETLIIPSPVQSAIPNGWVTCEACGYIGPRHRFEKLDARGQNIALCPHCNQAQNLRFNLS